MPVTLGLVFCKTVQENNTTVKNAFWLHFSILDAECVKCTLTGILVFYMSCVFLGFYMPVCLLYILNFLYTYVLLPVGIINK